MYSIYMYAIKRILPCIEETLSSKKKVLPKAKSASDLENKITLNGEFMFLMSVRTVKNNVLFSPRKVKIARGRIFYTVYQTAPFDCALRLASRKSVSNFSKNYRNCCIQLHTVV